MKKARRVRTQNLDHLQKVGLQCVAYYSLFYSRFCSCYPFRAHILQQNVLLLPTGIDIGQHSSIAECAPCYPLGQSHWVGQFDVIWQSVLQSCSDFLQENMWNLYWDQFNEVGSFHHALHILFCPNPNSQLCFEACGVKIGVSYHVQQSCGKQGFPE